MSKKKTDRLFEDIRNMAMRLTEDDEALTAEEVRKELRETGVDADDLRVRFHESVKKLAERERLANRAVPLSLKRAVDSTRPMDQLPSDPVAATAFAKRWLERFRSTFALPASLEGARAYRALDNLSEPDQRGLDELEAELKEKVKKENEPQT
jgi:hypothetical protein